MIKSIDYRNGNYQGTFNDLTREGVGLFINMDMRFMISEWHNNLLNGDTLVFFTHGKYLYGEWKEGSPSGINIFRSGDTILFANYEKGKIIGQFMVIFEKQNLVLIMEFNKNNCSILSKKQNIDLRQIEQIIRKMKFNNGNIKDKYFSLIQFIQESYAKKLSTLKFKEQKDSIYLGFENGVGIMLDHNNFINNIGSNLNCDGKQQGIGGKYHQDTYQEGDFNSGQTIKYAKNNKPVKKIRQIYKNYSRKSMNYLNSYVVAEIDSVFNYIENLLKQKIILKLSKTKLQQTKQFTQEQLNESLQYQPKFKSQNQRLKEMRQELYKSITRVNPNKQSKLTPSSSVTSFKTVNNQKVMEKHDQNKWKQKKQPQENLHPKCSKFLYDKIQQLKRSAIQQENTFEVQKYEDSDEIKQTKKQKQPQVVNNNFSVFQKKKYQQINLKEKNERIPNFDPVKSYQNPFSNQSQKNKLIGEGPSINSITSSISHIKQSQNYKKKYQEIQNEIGFRTPPKQIHYGEQFRRKKQIIKNMEVRVSQIQQQPDSIYHKNQITARFKSGCGNQFQKMNSNFQKTPEKKSINNNYKNQQNIYQNRQFQSPSVPKYQKIQQRRQRLLKQFKNLRNDGSPNMNMNNQNKFSTNNYLVSTNKPKKQSPCKQIDLESESEIFQTNQKITQNSNQITSSRKFIPVLHDKSNLVNINNNRKYNQQNQSFANFQKLNQKQSNKQSKEQFKIQSNKTPSVPVIIPQQNRPKTALQKTPRKFSYLADIEM